MGFPSLLVAKLPVLPPSAALGVSRPLVGGKVSAPFLDYSSVFIEMVWRR